MKTYEIFRDTDVSVLPTFTVNDWESLKGGTCVVKPDDGAACEDTFFLKDVESIKDWLTQNNASQRHIIQSYQPGVPASLSCIFNAGKVQLLSCNEQLIMLRHNVFSFKGVIVNGMVDYWVELEQLATKVAQRLPSLKGYVGIDVIINQNSDENNEIILLEINPRMTSSFVVMAEAIGANPAALLINTLMGGSVNGPILQRNRVCFDLPVA
jgi:predicted ATP-grasp superfamily ATP-dependent carboligase